MANQGEDQSFFDPKTGKKREKKKKAKPGSKSGILQALGVFFGRGGPVGAPASAAAEKLRQAGFK